jgi:acetolactate synthase-1/2/3 large subunit
MTTVAQALAHSLLQAGIDTVFGLPGGENVEVLDALRQQGTDFVLVHNESSAVYMADATARLTGKPGVCLTTLGPGAANAYCGVAHAYFDRAPVLLITAQPIGEQIGRHTHQMLDLQATFGPVTKASLELTTAGSGQMVRNALESTTTGRPGPVHLGLSSEMSARAIQAGAPPEVAPSDQTTSPLDLSVACAALRAAHRPVMVVGLGVEPDAPYAELKRLAETLQAPVITCPKAKGSLPEDHPLAGGTIGLTRTDPAYELLDEADLIVAIGFDVVELVKVWDQPQPLIWIAPWPNEDPVIPAATELVGSLKPILEPLADVRNNPDPDWGEVRVAKHRRELAELRLPEPRAGRLRPQTVLDALRRAVPRGTLISTDVGSHKILTALHWPALKPNRYLVSNGLSAMGFGLPAAIAAARVLKEPVVCITGDGGLAMTLGELGLLKALELPVVIVLMNDDALDLIRSGQLRADRPAFGTEFSNPDFAAIARGYGIAYRQVTSEQACEEAVRQALTRDRPALIDALIDPVSYPTTPRRG